MIGQFLVQPCRRIPKLHNPSLSRRVACLLRSSTVIVETHEFARPGVTYRLRTRFVFKRETIRLSRLIGRILGHALGGKPRAPRVMANVTPLGDFRWNVATATVCLPSLEIVGQGARPERATREVPKAGRLDLRHKSRVVNEIGMELDQE